MIRIHKIPFGPIFFLSCVFFCSYYFFVVVLYARTEGASGVLSCFSCRLALHFVIAMWLLYVLHGVVVVVVLMFCIRISIKLYVCTTVLIEKQVISSQNTSTSLSCDRVKDMHGTTNNASRNSNSNTGKPPVCANTISFVPLCCIYVSIHARARAHIASYILYVVYVPYIYRFSHILSTFHFFS